MTEAATTQLGSPISPRWSARRAKEIERLEGELEHRICGAVSVGGGLCVLEPDHENGRCRFHGGTERIGGQPGNRNALRHGLYSRRLRRCGPECPQWLKCIHADQDVAKLQASQRPACAFEAEEYESTVSTILDQLGIRMEKPGDGTPVELSWDSDGDEILSHTAPPTVPNGYAFARMMAAFAAESFALTKVMLQRAAAHLDERDSANSFGMRRDSTPVRPPRPAKETAKNPHNVLPARTVVQSKAAAEAPPGAVQAYGRLSRELRQWHKVLIDTAKEVFTGEGKVHYVWSRETQRVHDDMQLYVDRRVANGGEEPDVRNYICDRTPEENAGLRERFMREVNAMVGAKLHPAPG